MVSTDKITISLVAACLIAAAPLSAALAQQADAELGTIDEDTPLTDENLDGLDDDQNNGRRSTSDVQFSTNIDGEETPTDDAAFDGDANTAPAGLRRSGSQRGDQGNQRARPTQRVGIIQPDGSISPLANVPADPVQGGSANRDDSPYAALGIRVGTFNLFPVLTQTIGSTTNAEASENGSSAFFSQTDARLTAVSNWALHELRGEVGGSYQTYIDNDSEDLPTFDSNLQLRIDHSRNLTSRIGATYNLTTESAESDNLTVPPPLYVTERPNVHRMSGFAEVEKQAGRFSALLRGTITQSIYDGAALSDGSTLSQGDRTNTLYELEGRVGYETSATPQPFVEASVGARQYRRAVDRNGNQRDSMLYALRAGLEFDRGDKLNGEIAVGYATEQFDDAAINDLSGLTIDASINWSPQRLTTFTATAQSEFTGSTNVNEAGSVTYAVSLDAVHDLRPNLSLNARVLASLRDYDDSGRQDKLLQGQIGAEWRLSRSAALIATLGHETLDSTDASSSYEATTARAGLRLQR
ncbi:MAG: outer membrane beta-barrel protein [Rhizobiaceae bacterium]